jgi:hypothetical protein
MGNLWSSTSWNSWSARSENGFRYQRQNSSTENEARNNSNAATLESHPSIFSILFGTDSSTQESDQDSWLFGRYRRGNLSFLSSPLGRGVLAEIHQKSTVKCPVQLQKSSLKLVPVEVHPETQKPTKYKVCFQFDCTEECAVEVLYAVTEHLENGDLSFSPAPTHQPKIYPLGMNNIYEQPMEQFLDVTKYQDDDLVYKGDKNYYPVVIILSAKATIKLCENASQAQRISQITYVALIQCADGTYAMKPAKQKLRFNDNTYSVYDIYGLDQQDNTDPDKMNECVICISEPRTTVLVPCRHLCLCSSCAKRLIQQSYKCPICRAPAKSLIEIKTQMPHITPTNSLQINSE